MLDLRKGKCIVVFVFFAFGIVESQAQIVNRPMPLIPVVKNYKVYKNDSKMPNFALYNKRGYFCKLEDKVYQNSLFPVLFRLGSKSYVDQLEHK